jgi:hypothetical protein
MVGDAGEVDPPAAEFDEERHMQPAQPDSIDGEEVARDDPASLLTQERPPARGGASGCRVKTVSAQHPPDRAGRHPDAKVQQLAVDALVAPPGFSRASRTTRYCTSSEIGGRPMGVVE